MLVQVKRKSQITIPLKAREAAGIAEGDVLDLEVKNKEIILKPVISKKMKIKLIPARELKKLEGIVSLGGDSVKDSEAIWDDV